MRNTVSSVDDVVEADIAHVESIQMVTQTIKLLITPSLSPTSLRLIPGSCNDSDRCSSCVWFWYISVSSFNRERFCAQLEQDRTIQVANVCKFEYKQKLSNIPQCQVGMPLMGWEVELLDEAGDVCQLADDQVVWFVFLSTAFFFLTSFSELVRLFDFFATIKPRKPPSASGLANSYD